MTPQEMKPEVRLLIDRIGGPIFDYSVTTPYKELMKSYFPYPEHLNNYKRIYKENSTGGMEADRFKDEPIETYLDFVSANGIGKLCIKARDIERTFGLRIPNETVAEFAQQFPDRIVAFAGVDPNKGMQAVSDLEHAVRVLGLTGLNIQLYENKLPADDKKMYPIYAKCCELGIPINLHCSVNFSTSSLIKYGTPLALDEVAVDFPDLTIIVSPPGWPWVHELIAIAWRHPNVYISISAVRPRLLAKAGSGYEPLFTYGNSVLQDKMIFASSWPLLPLQSYVEEFLSLPWKPEVLPKILRENGMRACGISD